VTDTGRDRTTPDDTSGQWHDSGTAEPLVYSVEHTAELLGISRAFAYEAVRRGEIPSIRIGRRILVPRAALARLLA
jgi:excisionase family DNA binding protein